MEWAFREQEVELEPGDIPDPNPKQHRAASRDGTGDPQALLQPHRREEKKFQAAAPMKH